MSEIKTSLSVPAEAFVRKFSEHRKVSLSVAIDQIISQVVKTGGIEIKDSVIPDSLLDAEIRVRSVSSKKTGSDDGPQL